MDKAVDVLNISGSCHPETLLLNSEDFFRFMNVC